MRKWLLSWFFVFGCLGSLWADGPISFSPVLPKSWFVKTDKDLTVENTVGHVVVIVRTNDLCMITIATAKLSKEDAARDLQQNCQNLYKDLIKASGGNYKLTESELTVKTIDGRKVAEESFSIAAPKGLVHGFLRCWRSNDKIFNWTALATNAPIEKQKEILDVAASIKFEE